MPAMTLRWHLMALVLAVLLPMIAFSSIVIVAFGREQTAAVQRGAVGTARATMSAVDEYLTGSIRTLEALSALPSLDAGDLRQFHEDAARALSSQPAWLTISLFSPDGRQLVNVLRPVGASLPAVAERRSFDAVVATRRPVMGDLASRELTGQPDFAIRVPVVRRGALVYVLTAVVKPASLLDVLTRQALPEDWVGTIFDGDKKIVARTKNLEAFLARPVSPEFGALLDAGGREGWAVTHTLEGLPVNTAFVRSSISGWGVGLGMPATSVAAPLRRSLLALIGGGIALTGLALLGALLVGRRIVLPLVTLASVAKAFGERGHLPADRHAGVAEIEDLRRAFVHAAALRERADVNARRLAAIVESSDDAIIGKTLEGLVTSWNSAATRMFGYTEAEAVGRPIAFIVPPSRLDEEADILRRLARGEAVEAFETVRRHKDGHSIDVALSISPIRDGAGTITGASTIARDIGPQKRAEAERTALLSAERRAREAAEAAEREASFLADVTAVLGSSLDYDTTLARVARLAIPVLTDLCAIDLLEPDGRTRRVAAAHVDAAKEALVAAVRTVHGLNSDAPHGVPAVIRTRRAALVTSATEADLAAAARDPEQLTMFHKLGLKSWIIVPLIAREQILGAMTFVITESSRRYTARDVALAEAVANRAAVAIDNARLYREADAARILAETASSEARRAQREAEIFGNVTAAATTSLDLDTVLERVVNGAKELAGADVGRIALRDPATARMVFRYSVGSRLADRHPVEVDRGSGLGGHVWRTGTPYRSEDHRRDPHRHPGDEALLAQEGTIASLVVPVRLHDQVEGLIYLDKRSDRAFSDRDETLVGRFADHAAVAIDNARLLAAERRARGEAEAANRAKDEFLAVLSHELRTPLNAVYGWARMLRAGQVPAEATERGLEAIVRNANAQVQLIDDLLDISRVITGKMRLDVRPVDLRTVIEAALDSVRPAAVAKDIRVQTVLDPRAGPITGDPDRLQQVVWNLLMNAVKFTPRGGRIQVHLQRVNSHVEIVVSDTGLGMSADVLPFIFDRFRQGDSSSTRVHTGLGLGLALVKHFVELHGGNVTAQSPGEGKGATFIVTLPLTIAEISAGPAPREHPTATSLELLTLVTRLDGLRVLVVDDDRDALDLASAILSQAGAVVRTCSSASEALQAFPEWRPDVLVSDIEMPGEDGYALIRKIRALESERTGKTPAVALTAYGRVQDRMLALTAGFNMHVPKPVDPGELTTIIASLAARAPQPSGS
jgi:PAS domain S-box-containing protein